MIVVVSGQPIAIVAVLHTSPPSFVGVIPFDRRRECLVEVVMRCVAELTGDLDLVNGVAASSHTRFTTLSRFYVLLTSMLMNVLDEVCIRDRDVKNLHAVTLRLCSYALFTPLYRSTDCVDRTGAAV